MRFSHFASLVVLCCASTASAQFNLAQNVNQASFPNESVHQIESQHILLVMSDDGKRVTAFSAITGTADEIVLKEKLERFQPILGESVAVFHQGKTAYGFSAVTGKWDSVNVDSDSIVPVVARKLICFSTENSANAFGASHGKWLSTRISRKIPPTVRMNFVTLEFDSQIYVCSDTSKSWTMIDLRENTSDTQ